ncbi:flagellar export protein FliJ [Treponema primitia ZAS-2]|uniref:Flagellar FliJ protein n=1 Tax=Treponema primitia (strain ATCC BAA-887 / DSM 12427 / ZAS-2) TaxID=545694 RepID=F5YGM4_TREPZ|nr:flagellar export protein FliJ [Treponema primitia]AEF84027.1 flagellar export protein FliJ [Treponema primitia ZAS-2]
MRRFRFALQKVLELREHVEAEAKIELGRAMGALNLIEQRIKTVAEQRNNAVAERFAPGRDFSEMQNYERYIVRLDQTKEKLLKDASLAELDVAEKRDIYLEAARDRKVLDKVKERRTGEYRKEALAEENKELDEVAGRLLQRSSPRMRDREG